MTRRIKVVAVCFMLTVALIGGIALSSLATRTSQNEAFRAIRDKVRRQYANGDYESVEKTLSQDTDVSDVSVEAMTILAKSLYMREDTERAATVLERIVNGYPHATEAAMWLARIRLAENKPREAEKAILGALTFNDNDSRLLSLLSSVYERLGDYPRAIHYGTIACSFSDELAASELRLGRLYLRMGEFEVARAHVQRAKLLSTENGPLRSAIPPLEERLTMEERR